MVESSHHQEANLDSKDESQSLPAAALVENLAEVGKPPNPWGTGARKLYMMCAIVYLCSTMNGISHPFPYS